MVDKRDFFEREASAMLANDVALDLTHLGMDKSGMDQSNFTLDARASRIVRGMDESKARRKLLRVKAFSKAIRKSKYQKKAKGLVTTPFVRFKNQLTKLKRYFSRHRHELRAPIFSILWMVWLLLGTLFFAYAPLSNLGFIKGFYMALNIGYSIGAGYPSEDSNDYLYFSSCYVLVGASFVGAALGFFADKVAKDNESWFTRMEQKKRIEDAIRAQEGLLFHGKVQAWIYHYSSVLRAISIWGIFVIAMIMYSTVIIKWPFREAQYFAISSLSTGGHWSIPNDSPDWLFGMTGLFIMFGVPIMALAMAQTAYVFISNVDIDEAKATIDAVVTKEEIEFLQDLGMQDFDGTIDRAEFIILCMVRMGTDPGLIAYITQRFMELNFYTGNPLTVAEITQGQHRFHQGRIRRRSSLFGLSFVETVTEMQAIAMSLTQGKRSDDDEDEECSRRGDNTNNSRDRDTQSRVSFVGQSCDFPSEEGAPAKRRSGFLPMSLLSSIDESMEFEEEDETEELEDTETEIQRSGGEQGNPAPDSFADESGKDDMSTTLQAKPKIAPHSKESSFLKRLVHKLGLEEVGKQIASSFSTSSSTTSTEACLDATFSEPRDEAGDGNFHMQSTVSFNPIRQLVSCLEKECVGYNAPEKFHAEESKEACVPSSEEKDQMFRKQHSCSTTDSTVNSEVSGNLPPSIAPNFSQHLQGHHTNYGPPMELINDTIQILPAWRSHLQESHRGSKGDLPCEDCQHNTSYCLEGASQDPPAPLSQPSLTDSTHNKHDRCRNYAAFLYRCPVAMDNEQRNSFNNETKDDQDCLV